MLNVIKKFNYVYIKIKEKIMQKITKILVSTLISTIVPCSFSYAAESPEQTTKDIYSAIEKDNYSEFYNLLSIDFKESLAKLSLEMLPGTPIEDVLKKMDNDKKIQEILFTNFKKAHLKSLKIENKDISNLEFNKSYEKIGFTRILKEKEKGIIYLIKEKDGWKLSKNDEDNAISYSSPVDVVQKFYTSIYKSDFNSFFYLISKKSQEDIFDLIKKVSKENTVNDTIKLLKTNKDVQNVFMSNFKIGHLKALNIKGNDLEKLTFRLKDFKTGKTFVEKYFNGKKIGKDFELIFVEAEKRWTINLLN